MPHTCFGDRRESSAEEREEVRKTTTWRKKGEYVVTAQRLGW